MHLKIAIESVYIYLRGNLRKWSHFLIITCESKAACIYIPTSLILLFVLHKSRKESAYYELNSCG